MKNNYLKKVLKKIKGKIKGFTLVELLAVIVVLAIIMLIAIPAVLNTLTSAKRKSFVEYVDKVFLTTQKKVLEEEIGGTPSVGCKVYKIKSDLGLTNTGDYDGFVLVKRDGFTEDSYYITLHDDEYKIESYRYDGSLNTENIERITSDEEVDIDKACAMAGCTSCSAEDNQTATGICDSIQIVTDSNPGSFNGNGTKGDPYKIESIEDLVALSKGTNDGSLGDNKYYRLELDLSFACDKSYKDSSSTTFGDINGDGEIKSIKEELTSSLGWVPIGNEDHPFTSTILGNNKKIYGLYINTSDKYVYSAFIGYSADSNNEELINNISFLDVNITEKEKYSGIVIGFSNSPNKKRVIDNIKLSGKMECTASYCGGILGRGEYDSKQDITNIINKATFKSNSGESASVVGYANFGIWKNIYNYAEVSLNGGWASGGIFASTGKGLEVENIYNYGRITSINGGYTAGVMGYFQNGTFNSVYNYGNITCSKGYCGGIVGGSWNDSDYRDLFISNIYNYGNVSGSASPMGGCNGKLTYTHEINAYNYGTVTYNGTEGGVVGGVVGHVNYAALLYNAGNHANVSLINGSGRIGGVVGYGEGTISNVYNYGHITSTRKEDSTSFVRAGGLIGDGGCSNCYSIADVDVNMIINGDNIGIGFGGTNSKSGGNVVVVGTLTNKLSKVTSGNSFGAMAGYFSSPYETSFKNYYAKAVVRGIPSMGLMAGNMNWNSKTGNFYIDLDTDSNGVFDGVTATGAVWDNFYYSLKNTPSETDIDFAKPYNFSQVNGLWFRDTLKLGNNWKYENGLYPKLYKLLPNGNISNELVEGQKDIPIK